VSNGRGCAIGKATDCHSDSSLNSFSVFIAIDFQRIPRAETSTPNGTAIADYQMKCRGLMANSNLNHSSGFNSPESSIVPASLVWR
jgi:hypothetical protein